MDYLKRIGTNLDANSTTDDAALRLKVEEAMNVYDEYIKGQSGGAPPSMGDPNGAMGGPNGTENVDPTTAGGEGKDGE